MFYRFLPNFFDKFAWPSWPPPNKNLATAKPVTSSSEVEDDCDKNRKNPETIKSVHF